MIKSIDITPVSEDEEIYYYPELKCDIPGDYIRWICFCGNKCIITGKQMYSGTLGGICSCGRQYKYTKHDLPRDIKRLATVYFTVRRIPA